MKMTLPALVFLSVAPCMAQQSPTQQSEELKAHEAVLRFLKGIQLAALPEGKQLLAETQWIVGRADRGRNYYSRPDYSEVSSLFASFFDTDVPSLKGYKELFDMKAVTKGGATRDLKYLVVSYKDTVTGKWKVLSSLDNDGGESSLDIDEQIDAFRNFSTQAKLENQMRENAAYGTWLLCGGRLREAKVALKKAKSASFEGDMVLDLQINVLLSIIDKLAPQLMDKK